MRKSVLLVALVMLMLLALTSCAGMDPHHQQNMVTNAAVWGGIGAATGCILSEATGGKCGKGAAIGGVAGAYLGAGNTPVSTQNQGYANSYPSPYDRGSVYSREKYRRMEELRQRERAEWERNEKRRAWNDAEAEFYGH